MKKGSNKLSSINARLQNLLGELIRREIQDPRISPLTSVLSVSMAPDCKTCKVRCSVLGSDEERKRTLAGLESAKGFLRTRLAKALTLHTTPELIFQMDDSIEYGMTMSRKIDEVMSQQAQEVEPQSNAASDSE
ncbi:MAG: 30S ribosome-binding factor RbfA [Clostridium sp.]|jgi:ribosome-binding factor A|nr:30S ribosome-binding factor RbfA [Clostridium sp.]